MVGTYAGHRRRPGQIFEVAEGTKLGSWLVEVDAEGNALGAAAAAKPKTPTKKQPRTFAELNAAPETKTQVQILTES